MFHTLLVTCISITEEERLKLNLCPLGGSSILCLFSRLGGVTLSILPAADAVIVNTFCLCFLSL